ncbi:btb poz domain containing protein [Ophiostoma piceae UAMH 11346]|uniref:Btb poz domain containing protein n=1 Tax=Ophiostoma piceae (strain UAMH 11346) TaxID=1262450 RepID=S3CGR7_OPHP1|nr:btb poz domain containing protein [Ophiostoma piceae UAMH 11346]
MFSRSHNKSFSKSQKISKASGSASASFSKESGISKIRRHESSSRRRPPTISSAAAVAAFSEVPQSPASPIVTLVIGREQRIFAAHEEVLCASPFFQQALQNHVLYYGSPVSSSPASVASPASPSSLSASKRIVLSDDEPEIFSSVLEYLYKGDYYPRLIHNKRHNSWELERPDDGQDSTAAPQASIYTHPLDGDILKDTVIYCAADRFGLDELKRISLRKQGLQSGIPCSTILSSARYAYAHTPDTDSKLRAHYLALIIRSRSTFKRSGTMQLEMYNGGSQLFFDLFVALCNHVDDISTAQASSPRSNRPF